MPAEESDRESDATSRDVTLEDLKLGRPIAREGLEIETKRPRFTNLTLLTASPGNPGVLISFDRDGIPLIVEFDPSSGDPRVDHALRSSVYRWRAKGARLDSLGEDETVVIELTIILNPRRPNPEEDE